jgi:hypothetical protein
MWFDSVNLLWKVYNGSSFVDSTSTFLGWACATSAAVVGARTVDFNGGYSPTNDISLDYHASSSVIFSNGKGGKINIYGTLFNFGETKISWDMAADLDSGVTEGASTMYYFYITNGGVPKISDVPPYDRGPNLKGWYHPHKPWRAVGYTYNNSSSNFANSVVCYGASEIPDHSISVNKLAPRMPAGLISSNEFISSAEVTLTANGSSGAVSIMGVSGRPILIFLTPSHGSATPVLLSDGSFTISLERRFPQISASWTAFTSVATYDAATSGSFAVPVGQTWVDQFAGRFQNEIVQYRLTLAQLTGTSWIVRGTLHAIPL